MFDYPTACRFGNPPSVQNSAAATSPGRRRPQYRLAPQLLRPPTTLTIAPP
jgi:hypothetical protein